MLLEYGGEFTATFEATLAPGITGEAVEFCGTEGRLYIDRQPLRVLPRRTRNAQPTVVKAYPEDLTLDHVEELPGLRAARGSCPTATC